MIYKKCVMTIDKNKATFDEDIYLYRLDKNIELYFTIVNNKYRFNKGDMNNIILITNASFFQVRLYKNAEIKYTFAIQPTDGGQAILTITDDLIDDPIEVGDYDFQISLLDEEKTSMISMPIVSKQLHVCEPLVSDDATMGKAILGLSKLATGEIKNAFDSEGNYIREIHQDGDILSASIINKFEEALDTNTKAIKSGTGTPYDDTQIKTDINTIKTDLGSDELTTTAKDVKGAVNEVAAQYKEIANLKSKIEILEEDPKQEDLYEGRMWIYSPVTYKVTNNLTNCVSSNKDTGVLKNSSYNATITPNSNYDLGAVIVTMGGGDITSTCVSNGIITITSVTGDIVITCTAISNLKPCTNITLSSNALTFTTTDTQTLTVTVTPSDTTDKIVWSVSPTGIANVNNGIVTPITNGSCVITATCGSKSATCNITVNGIQEYTPPTDGLQLYLKGSDFTNDPQTTTLTDNSGNNNDVTATGFAYTNTSGSDGNGNIVFDGTDDKLYNSNQSLDISNGFTVIFKGSINDLAQTNKEILDMPISTGNQLSIIYGYVSNKIELYGDSLNFREGSQIAISDTNIHTIAYNYDGSVIKGYLDGTEVINITRTVNILLPITKVAIGVNSNGQSGHFSKITLNKFLFYNRGLSLSEITNILNNI